MDATVTMRFVNRLILPWLTIFFHTITNLSVDPQFFFFTYATYVFSLCCCNKVILRCEQQVTCGA